MTDVLHISLLVMLVLPILLIVDLVKQMLELRCYHLEITGPGQLGLDVRDWRGSTHFSPVTR